MESVSFEKILQLYGKWNRLTDNSIDFSGGNKEGSHGLALLSKNVTDGTIECKIKFSKYNENMGAFIVLRSNGQSKYLAVGLGGYSSAFTLLEGEDLKVNRLLSAGNIDTLVENREYELKIILEGQRVQLFVDGVKVIDFDRMSDTQGASIGFFAFKGTEKVNFSDLKVESKNPMAFIAMQFSDPYNGVYKDAIEPTITEIGYTPLRIDDISMPGQILSDIIAKITESSIVVAEVSVANPNVYYEIGFAHAIGKSTILLAQRGTQLPFDLKIHRCIFYDDTIIGRGKLLNDLKSALSSAISAKS